MAVKKYVRKTNLEALKQALDNQKSGGGGFRFWKPQKYGKYVVRFLPQQSSDGFFYKEAAQHKIGENYYFCPKVEGDNCPICKAYKKLWDINTDASKELAREIKPRKQYLYNIIVKDEAGVPAEDPTKVQVYMSGKKLYDKLMDYFFDSDYGDLTDVEEGFDFVINKEQGAQGFPNYDNSRPRSKPSPLHEDEEIIEEILGNVKDLTKQIDYKSEEELEKALQSYLSGEKGFNLDSPSDNTPKAKTQNSKPEPEDEEEDEVDEDDISDFKNQLLKDLGADD